MEIEEAIRTLDSDGETWEPLRKRDKATARSLARSLERVERVLNRKDVRQLLDRMMFDFDGWLGDLKQFRKDVEEIAVLALGQPKPSAGRFTRKHKAVAAAAKLLEAHGLRLTATQRTLTRQASLFCRVAAVLYGDERADPYHQCRAFLKARNRVAK